MDDAIPNINITKNYNISPSRVLLYGKPIYDDNYVDIIYDIAYMIST